VPCDSCEACTAALAAPKAKAAQSGPLAGAGPVCVTIKGPGATFDGAGHALTPGKGVGVRVEAPDVLLSHLRVEGGAAGVEVAAPAATLYDVTTSGAGVGVRAVAAPGLRLDRVALGGGQVGLALGAVTGGKCAPGATLTSPGVVVQRSKITGAEVGIAACEAVPVLSDNTVEGNGVGLLQGAPKPPAGASGPEYAGPYDPCVCASDLAGVAPGTTVFFSSGCGGCEVHEGWLPEVRGQGHDVLLRPSDIKQRVAQDVFDAHLRRCAPGIIDALGTPGCVPNYACAADGALFKRKVDGRLAVDARIDSAADLADFAARCASAGAAHYDAGKPACVAHGLFRNRLCGNRVADVRGAAPAGTAGSDNVCGKLDVGADAKRLGCRPGC
jgi:hypothetical protein